jgi:shikimate dehydrogenase
MAYYALGLIGHPVKHSLSPVILNAALTAHGIAGEYRLFDVPESPNNEPRMTALMDSLRAGIITGLNVTIPHKQVILNYLNELTPAAQSIGAVNTIYRDGNRLVGDNTDAPGFLKPLENYTPSLDEDKTALVLGAGGAARAVTYSLHQLGWKLTIAARRIQQAQKLADGLGKLQTDEMSESYSGLCSDDRCTIRVVALEYIPRVMEWTKVDLVVNTTPIGMTPYEDANPWPDSYEMPPGAIIYDLVYNPPETALLRAAKDASLECIGGLDMLIEQAALAFECWIGLDAPRDAMRKAVEEQLNR